jgi:hypothetical protein
MHIHLISFDVPYPPNYGGVMDIFYKIKMLKENNVDVSLHCFEYGRAEQNELNKVCKEVFYYKRKLGLKYQFSLLPYIIITRNNNALLQNLLKNNAPILFEGLHCCYLLNNKTLQQRKKIVRMHNIEHNYYNSLAKAEKNILKKIYFFIEALKLKLFESKLKNANVIFAISPNDKTYLIKQFSNVSILPPFHFFNKVTSKPGKSNYSLYHGNLAVPENNEAAMYLTEKVFNDLETELIIAGNSPSQELENAVKKHKNIKLLPNLSTEEILHLVAEAHINVLPTFQSTGVKLKLLIALYTGKFCLVNTPMVENTGLENLCVIADKPKEMKNLIMVLLSKEFSESEVNSRNNCLNKYYSPELSVKQIISVLE